MIFWRGKASYLYSTAVTIQGLQRKPREGSDRLEDDSKAFRKFPVPKGTFGKSFWRLVKLWQSHRVGLSWVESRRLEPIQRTRENARTSSRMTLRTSGEIPSAWRNLWEGFPKVTKALAILQSHPKFSWGGLEHCLPVIVTEFKLSEATLASPFVASHSIWRLVFSFVTFRISTMNVYMLACIYCVFLEIVRI